MAESPPVRPEASPEGDDDRRCSTCGYQLTGIAARGTCPECGSQYAPQSLLKPWPSAGRICWQLGWPILGVMLGTAMSQSGSIIGLVILWAMLVAIPVNSYSRVRKLLKDSLPDKVRKHGFVAVFRAVGTTLCVVLFLVFFGAPIACIGCVMLM